jgi:hypothetical protein
LTISSNVNFLFAHLLVDNIDSNAIVDDGRRLIAAEFYIAMGFDICKRPDDKNCHRLFTAGSNLREIKPNDFAIIEQEKEKSVLFPKLFIRFR